MVINRKKNAASCDTCTMIEYCKLKDMIRDPVIKITNCAEEGCVKYDGPGFQYGGFASKAIISHLKTGAIISEKIAKDNYACGKKRLHDNIARFQKKHNIVQYEKDGEVLYLLIPPPAPAVKEKKIKKNKINKHTT